MRDLRSALETLLRSGQNHLVLQEAEQFFARSGADSEAAQWVAAAAAAAAGALGRWSAAVSWAEKGLVGSRLDREAEGRLRFYLGTALMYTGDLFRSQRELGRAQELVARTPALRSLSGHILFNLGYGKRALRATAEAVDCFREAERAFAAEGRTARALTCRYEVAWSLLLEERAAEAWPYLEGVEAELSRLGDPSLEVDVAIARSLFHAIRGEYAEAEQICRDLIGTGEVPPRQRADAAWILGRSALESGDLEAAARHLNEAYEVATRDWWPAQIERIEEWKGRLASRRCLGR